MCRTSRHCDESLFVKSNTTMAKRNANAEKCSTIKFIGLASIDLFVGSIQIRFCVFAHFLCRANDTHTFIWHFFFDGETVTFNFFPNFFFRTKLRTSKPNILITARTEAKKSNQFRLTKKPTAICIKVIMKKCVRVVCPKQWATSRSGRRPTKMLFFRWFSSILFLCVQFSFRQNV